MTTELQVNGLGLFAQRGFTLRHPDDHILQLLHEGELIGRFSQTGATEESLQNEGSLHLVKCHGWDGCLWSRKNENQHS